MVLHAVKKSGQAGKMMKIARRMQITGYCYDWIFSICQALVKEFYPMNHNLLYPFWNKQPKLPQDIVVETLYPGSKLADFISFQNLGPRIPAKLFAEIGLLQNSPKG